VISPWRWLAAVVIPLIFLFWGIRKKSLDISGGILGSENNIICYDYTYKASLPIYINVD